MTSSMGGTETLSVIVVHRLEALQLSLPQFRVLCELLSLCFFRSEVAVLFTPFRLTALDQHQLLNEGIA
jgi:hypothetical protein